MGKSQEQDRAFKSIHWMTHLLQSALSSTVPPSPNNSFSYTLKYACMNPLTIPQSSWSAHFPNTPHLWMLCWCLCLQHVSRRGILCLSQDILPLSVLTSKGFIFTISKSWVTTLSLCLMYHLTTDKQFCTGHCILGKGICSKVISGKFSKEFAYIKSVQSTSIK